MTAGLSSQLLESLLTPGRIAVAILVFIVSSFIVDFTWKPSYPGSIPRVGFGGGITGNIRNWIGYVTHFGSWMEEGYEKVSQCLSGFLLCFRSPPRPLLSLTRKTTVHQK